MKKNIIIATLIISLCLTTYGCILGFDYFVETENAIDQSLTDEDIVKAYCEYEGKTFVSYEGVDDAGYLYRAIDNDNGYTYYSWVDMSYASSIAVGMMHSETK